MWKRGDIVMGLDIGQGTGSDKSAISITKMVIKLYSLRHLT